MAERTIVGVDFSGAQAEGKTWVAKGHMPSTEHLIIDSVQPILRNDLLELLPNLPPTTVVALDFPFGLPRVFLESLCVHENTMKDVWQHITSMSFDKYKKKCKNFGTHPKRTGDKLHSVSMSALNIRLVPMTYHGIKMLHKLDEAHTNRWWIPPLDSGEMPADRIALLEVMPGAFLRSIGFDYKTVKSYKNAEGALDTRDYVINHLSAYSGMKMPNLLDFRWGFRANDDPLDSVIAALAAASWTRNRDDFLHPKHCELADARLEGWIYAPPIPSLDEIGPA